MKKVTIAFLLVWTWSIGCTQGQHNPNLTKIDSIQNLLNNHPQEDTTRVKWLNDLARVSFHDLQSKQWLIAARQARQLSKKLSYRKGEALYLRTMAMIVSGSPLALYYETHARWIFKEIKEKDEFDKLGIIEPALNSQKELMQFIEKRIAQLHEGLKYAESENDNELKAIVLIAISGRYAYLKRWNDAIAYEDKGLAIFKELKQPALAIFPLLVKNYCFNQLGKEKEAKEAEIQSNAALAKIENSKDEAILMAKMSDIYFAQNRNALGIEYALKANNLLEKIGDQEFIALIYQQLGLYFSFMSMPKKSVEYYKKAILIREKIKMYDDDIIRIYFNLGYELTVLKELEEANLYISKARKWVEKSTNSLTKQYGMLRSEDAKGQMFLAKEKYREALSLYQLLDEKVFDVDSEKEGKAYLNFYMAQCYHKLGNLKESIRYGEKSYKPSLALNHQPLLIKVCSLLSEVYEQSGQPLKAQKYLKKQLSLLKEKETQDISNTLADMEIMAVIERSEKEKDQLAREKFQKEQESKTQRWWLFSIAGALCSTLALMFLLYRNNLHKQKANALLMQQKEEIHSQRDKAETALSQLRSTQSQLIQSEKLASLGELTAGIAHEIQNPLNFVNNFAEVSAEMLDEMHEELEKGDTTEAIAIATDLKTNLEKINHHGQRASSIVKGMLEHSRASTGAKEPTDLNALADEYLRLAYHGLRAKDGNFNATLETHFDPDLPMVSVITQDIGRVLLNLINNAFYAVHQRATVGASLADALLAGAHDQPTGTRKGRPYQPTVTISTQKTDDQIIIKVQDNGNGIPDAIRDKIFQPFFTTKPTGQGTGLGLSLAYDILKSHGGELKIENTTDEGATFIIQLPFTNHR